MPKKNDVSDALKNAIAHLRIVIEIERGPLERLDVTVMTKEGTYDVIFSPAHPEEDVESPK